MHLVHHPLYVLLATLVAVLGSWTALDLFLRVKAWVGQPRAAWLIAASVAMGLCLWAMHFIAILGFEVSAPVRYDPSLTVLSLALAIASTGFGFAVAGRGRPSRGQLLGAGLVMGIGICVMQYVGLSALRSAAVFAYRPPLVILSFAGGGDRLHRHPRGDEPGRLAQLAAGGRRRHGPGHRRHALRRDRRGAAVAGRG